MKTVYCVPINISTYIHIYKHRVNPEDEKGTVGCIHTHTHKIGRASCRERV